jgi:prephenate dehydratase
MRVAFQGERGAFSELAIVQCWGEAARAALAGAAVTITGGTSVPIRPLLLACPGVTLADVRHVSSHPAALAQCATFLARHPQWLLVTAYDTAGAARDLHLAPDPTRAVIASAAAAERYALSVLHAQVADRDDNTTRFVTITARVSPRAL